MKRYGELPILSDGFKLLKECKAELINVKRINISDNKTPWFTGVTFTNDNRILLIDYDNNACYLLDSTYDTITSYKFSVKPFCVCMIGENDLAIALPIRKSIHILSLQDNSMTPIWQIPTQYRCFGIAAYNEDLIVSGPCGDGKKYYWSLVTLEGKKKSYHEFDCEGTHQTYITVNALKTRLYVSVFKDSSLHCFSLDGRKYFTFKHTDLQCPHGVALDRDDNVYMLGDQSKNIFQVSPDGSLIQIILKDFKKNPTGICFDQNGDKFVLTHYKDADLSVYALKDKDG